MPTEAEAARERAELRRRFATRLRDLGLALELLAEDVIGDEDRPIEWIAAGSDGRAWLVLIDAGGGSGELIERALVQRAWVTARIRDWRQLAPGLPLREGVAPGVILVAESAGRSLRIAAREAFGDASRVVEWGRGGADAELQVTPAPPRARAPEPAVAPRLRSVFRTGLTDADLAG
jgi:hypothetical protein